MKEADFTGERAAAPSSRLPSQSGRGRAGLASDRHEIFFLDQAGMQLGANFCLVHRIAADEDNLLQRLARQLLARSRFHLVGARSFVTCRFLLPVATLVPCGFLDPDVYPIGHLLPALIEHHVMA